MKIASWNVNSLRVRLPQVLTWLESAQPDILALQELKLTDDLFPKDDFAEQGYQSVFAGQPTYNGVALLARRELTDVVRVLPDFADEQRRIIFATVNGVRVASIYVPNGESTESAKYQYKLAWLVSFEKFLRQQLAEYPDLIVAGDFNIAPEDRDVHDPESWRDKVLCSEPERAALHRLLEVGLQDTFRLFNQPEGIYSWWDYRAAGFRRNLGLRIDLLLASGPLAQRCHASYVDKVPRSWERPSDHAPVVAEFSNPCRPE